MRAVWNAVRVFTLAAVCVSGGAFAHSQATNSGDIRGTVTDPSGAVIPDVTVTVLNVETGVSKDYTSNKSGVFDTNSIVAGRYQVTFTKPGFETFTRGPITVEVGLTTVNAPLQLGSTNVVVSVNTDVPLLHTEDGSQTAILSSQDMEQLPNIGSTNGPDWENFMILLPGAANASSAGAQPGQVVSTNGNLPYNNVLQDGASTTLPASQNANPATFEDVQELQVSLSSFSAQYGVGGLIINQITKGGTDKFHGVLYEYFQNASLNSFQRDYSTAVTSKIPPNALNYDDFGGTVSGPVKVPFLGLNHRAFFFFGYDQIHNNTAAGGTQINTVPTVPIMAGDFTGGLTIYDPTNQKLPTGYGIDSSNHPYPIRPSFADEFGNGNKIPASLIDKVSNATQALLYPTPTNHIPYGHFQNQNNPVNGSGVLQQNFTETPPGTPNPWKRYFGRFDYDVTKSNRLTFSDTQGDQKALGYGAVAQFPVGSQLGDIDNNNAQVTDVWNISPRVVNEARFGFTDQLNFFTDGGTGIGTPAKIGWQFAKADVIPHLRFTRFDSGYAWVAPATNAVYKEFTFDPSDVVTLVKGKHILHFGGEFAFYRDDTTSWGNANAGQLDFNGQYTEAWTVDPVSGKASPNTGTGLEYADFLLGYANAWTASLIPEIGARLKKPQMFVQDDWKLRPNLTINLGLRYEISHGFNEVKGNIASFDPTVVNPATGTLGAYWYGETKANGRNSLEANVFSTVMPRGGFSWLVHPNTTIRGGAGLYSYNWSIDTYGALGQALDGSVQYSGSAADCSGGVEPVLKFDGAGTLYPLGNPANCAGTAGAPLPFTSPSQDPARFNGQTDQTVLYAPYHAPIPKSAQWNLGIEQQLGTNVAFTLSYVGSHGYNLAMPTDIDAPSVNNLFLGNTNGCGNAATLATCARPYPIYNGIGGSVYNAISNYHSLQAVITKRLSQGLSINANYVWSHFQDDQDSSGWGSRGGRQVYQVASTLQQDETYRNYGNSNFDVRNAFKTYVVYDLPFGKGKQFLNNNWLVDEVVGGLQASATVVLSSGNPFTVTATNNDLYQGGVGIQYPNRIPGVSLIPHGGHSRAMWFNPAAFSDPGSTFGNMQRNSVYGPGFESTNMSVLKAFHLPWERARLSFRVDAQNVFNHTTLGAPASTLSATNPNITLKDGTHPPILPGGTYVALSQTGNQITGTAINGRTLQIAGRFAF